MTKAGYRKIFLAVFLVWVILWVNFTVRDLTKKKYLKEYAVLLSRDTAGKASYTYGDNLFEFLGFCKARLPEGASYDTVGIIDLDFRRAVYYLYPHVNIDGAPYILVFDKPGFARPGYVPFKELDQSRFILKKA